MQYSTINNSLPLLSASTINHSDILNQDPLIQQIQPSRCRNDNENQHRAENQYGMYFQEGCDHRNHDDGRSLE